MTTNIKKGAVVIGQALGRIALERDIRAGLEEKIAESNARTEAASRAIKRLLASGCSTGDSIQDYILATGGAPDAQRLERFRAVNTHLAGKAGELIAFFSLETEHAPAPRNIGQPRVQMYLSVLQDDKLHIQIGKEPKCFLPIHSYAVCDDCPQDIHEITVSPVHDKWSCSFDVLKEPRSGEHPGQYRLAVYAGTDNVRSLPRYKRLTFMPGNMEFMQKTEEELGLPRLAA